MNNEDLGPLPEPAIEDKEPNPGGVDAVPEDPRTTTSPATCPPRTTRSSTTRCPTRSPSSTTRARPPRATPPTRSPAPRRTSPRARSPRTGRSSRRPDVASASLRGPCGIGPPGGPIPHPSPHDRGLPAHPRAGARRRPWRRCARPVNTCPQPRRTVSLPTTAASRSRSMSASRWRAESWLSRPSSRPPGRRAARRGAPVAASVRTWRAPRAARAAGRPGQVAVLEDRARPFGDVAEHAGQPDPARARPRDPELGGQPAAWTRPCTTSARPGGLQVGGRAARHLDGGVVVAQPRRPERPHRRVVEPVDPLDAYAGRCHTGGTDRHLWSCGPAACRPLVRARADPPGSAAGHACRTAAPTARTQVGCPVWST